MGTILKWLGTMIDYVEILPESKHRYSVIWLHGLGADGHDFESIVPEMNLPRESGIHFIFPHAPIIPVSINGGVEMRAWYDIKGMDLENRAEMDGINRSKNIVNSLIESEIEQGIQSENIFIAGFSQGGAIALHTALSSDKTFAGVIALSTYLPFENSLNIGEAIKKTPFFMAHGNYDPVVPFDFGTQALEFLKSNNITVEWNEYPMQHEVTYKEVKAIANFILGNINL